MHFDDSFEIEGLTKENVWKALSDPVTIRNSLPGCKCLEKVEDPDNVDYEAILEKASQSEEEITFDEEVLEERAFKEGESYAAIVSVSIGPVNPSFNTLVTIEEWEFPSGSASGEGTTGDSSFEMDSGMTLKETESGVEVDWEADVDVVGRLAQMGQRMIHPAANRIVKRFFKQVEQELAEATQDNQDENSVDVQQTQQKGGLIARIRRFLGFGERT